MITPIADLKNPTSEEVNALVDAFREAPGVIQSGHDLAVIAFQWMAERQGAARPLDGWWRGEQVQVITDSVNPNSGVL